MWESDDPTFPRVDVYGSFADLEADFGVAVTDLHRPFVDRLTRGLVAKLLHDPIVELKERSEPGTDAAHAKVLAELFGIDLAPE